MESSRPDAVPGPASSPVGGEPTPEDAEFLALAITFAREALIALGVDHPALARLEEVPAAAQRMEELTARSSALESADPAAPLPEDLRQEFIEVVDHLAVIVLPLARQGLDALDERGVRLELIGCDTAGARGLLDRTEALWQRGDWRDPDSEEFRALARGELLDPAPLEVPMAKATHREVQEVVSVLRAMPRPLVRRILKVTSAPALYAVVQALLLGLRKTQTEDEPAVAGAQAQSGVEPGSRVAAGLPAAPSSADRIPPADHPVPGPATNRIGPHLWQWLDRRLQLLAVLATAGLAVLGFGIVDWGMGFSMLSGSSVGSWIYSRVLGGSMWPWAPLLLVAAMVARAGRAFVGPIRQSEPRTRRPGWELPALVLMAGYLALDWWLLAPLRYGIGGPSDSWGVLRPVLGILLVVLDLILVRAGAALGGSRPASETLQGGERGFDLR
ncbi:hypothetical protein Bequi_02035 [Brachybacterium sp. JHP9]|uniref:Uncharacterized protein n=1 Tax=Brachybacterium equifaecis TaxID=2910770 RepID=A0ABT0QX70_9MICO|nr:hypothetical protein [Brachybacterium equifaecis]MCL6422180.1 hypothetical protein [Brachybacterium equifaecis]